MPSRIRWTAGRSRGRVVALGARGLAFAVRARSNRCEGSASSSLQRAGDRVEHDLRDAAEVAALHPVVVLHTDASQRRHLLAAKALDPTLAAEARQAGLLGSHPGTARGEEIAHLAPVVHDNDRTSWRSALGWRQAGR